VCGARAQDFYLPEKERLAVTTMPQAVHDASSQLNTPLFPTPRIPGTCKSACVCTCVHMCGNQRSGVMTSSRTLF
jgi:hypothetical protein